MTLGVAVLGAIAGGAVVAGFGTGFARATHPAWWTVAGLAVVIAALATLTTGPWARATADRRARRFGEHGAPGMRSMNAAELTGPPSAS